MRTKKLRGAKRISFRLENWKKENLNINLADLLSVNDRYYARLYIQPWNTLAFTNSTYPEAYGKLKLEMLAALIDVYYGWRHQLEEMGKPYYLKLWLFEPRFSKSQIVAATGNGILFYENLFAKATGCKFSFSNYGNLQYELKKFRWEHFFDEDCFDSTMIERADFPSEEEFKESKRNFNRLLKKSHRVEVISPGDEKAVEFYFFRKGDIWIGEIN